MLSTNKAVDFQLYTPEDARISLENPTQRPWLSEMRRLRSRVLYADGTRPAFGPGGERYCDPDPRDARSFHVTVSVEGEIAGCVRAMPLRNDRHDGVLDDLLGKGKLEDALDALCSKRDQCVEVSRLMLASEFRSLNLARWLVAASWSVALQLKAALIVAGLGTRDSQDRFISRFGLAPIPSAKPVRVEAFNDEVRPMFARVAAPAESFVNHVHQMHAHLFEAFQMQAAE